MASVAGFVHVTIDPRYLILSLAGVGVLSMNAGGVVGVGGCRYSVLVKLRNNPYRVAAACTLRRYSSTAVTPNSRVSSAYSRSYTGFPTDHVFGGPLC